MPQDDVEGGKAKCDPNPHKDQVPVCAEVWALYGCENVQDLLRFMIEISSFSFFSSRMSVLICLRNNMVKIFFRITKEQGILFYRDSLLLRFVEIRTP